MKILSIETSADETGVAILEIGGPLAKPSIKVLGNALASQIKLHEQYGGIYPMMAKREHQKNLPPLLAETLKQAEENPDDPDIDFIAVTTGPGLEPALWVGITFAEELGLKWNKPVVPVNHMEGHVFSVLYNLDKDYKGLELPALALLISGGHTELVYIKDFGNYEIIGRTLDDAAGEAFDKVARMLGLPYPGGPKISALAKEVRIKNEELGIKFPRPMINSKDLNFSFSGLKTAVLYYLRDNANVPKEYIAKEFEDAVRDVLVEKTRRALDKYSEIKTAIIAGGVSANTYITESFKKLVEDYPHLALHIPERELTTDNAIMIGIAGFVRVSLDSSLLTKRTPLTAQGNLSINSERSRTISSFR